MIRMETDAIFWNISCKGFSFRSNRLSYEFKLKRSFASEFHHSKWLLYISPPLQLISLLFHLLFHFLSPSTHLFSLSPLLTPTYFFFFNLFPSLFLSIIISSLFHIFSISISFPQCLAYSPSITLHVFAFFLFLEV